MESTTTEETSRDFKSQKTRYFSSFAQAHLSAFRPHISEGETLGKGPEIWRNVSEHCLVAGVFADILADELRLQADLREKVVKAAIIHDWFKKHESMDQTTSRKDGVLSLETLSGIKKRDEEKLRRMGISQDIIELTGANVPKTTEGPQLLPEKIIWYVDAMLSNTVPVPIRKRFTDLERGWDGEKEDASRAERNITFSNLYKEQYGGRSLYDVQRDLGDSIGLEFARSMGYQGETSQLPTFLAEKLVKRIRAKV